MRTIIPKIFSQTTKFGNLITFLFQGVYPQGKTGLISQHLCMRMSIIVFIGLLLYINFALNLNFLTFFSMILTLISPFSFKNNVRHHTVNFLKSCKPPPRLSRTIVLLLSFIFISFPAFSSDVSHRFMLLLGVYLYFLS